MQHQSVWGIDRQVKYPRSSGLSDGARKLKSHNRTPAVSGSTGKVSSLFSLTGPICFPSEFSAAFNLSARQIGGVHFSPNKMSIWWKKRRFLSFFDEPLGSSLNLLKNIHLGCCVCYHYITNIKQRSKNTNA